MPQYHPTLNMTETSVKIVIIFIHSHTIDAAKTYIIHIHWPKQCLKYAASLLQIRRFELHLSSNGFIVVSLLF